MIRHSEVFSGIQRKEFCWWGKRRIVSKVRFNKAANVRITNGTMTKLTMRQYFDNFPNVDPGLLVGEGSVCTVHYNSIWYENMTASEWTRPPSEQLIQVLRNFRLSQAHLIYQYTPKLSSFYCSGILWTDCTLFIYMIPL